MGKPPFRGASVAETRERVLLQPIEARFRARDETRDERATESEGGGGSRGSNSDDQQVGAGRSSRLASEAACRELTAALLQKDPSARAGAHECRTHRFFTRVHPTDWASHHATPSPLLRVCARLSARSPPRDSKEIGALSASDSGGADTRRHDRRRRRHDHRRKSSPESPPLIDAPPSVVCSTGEELRGDLRSI